MHNRCRSIQVGEITEVPFQEIIESCNNSEGSIINLSPIEKINVFGKNNNFQ